MTEITTKEALLQRARDERRRLEEALNRVTEAEMELPGVTGDWSIKDTLAHIAEWEQQFLGWYRAGRRGEIPERPDFENIDPFNRTIYEKHADRSLADVCAWFEASYRELVAALKGMTQEELFTMGVYAWTGDYPLAVYARANADEHYAEHADSIYAWLARQGR